MRYRLYEGATEAHLQLYDAPRPLPLKGLRGGERLAHRNRSLAD